MPAVPAAETPNVLVLPSPFFSDGDTIRLLEPADCDTRAVLGQVVSGAYDKPFIIDDGTTRSLHFSLSLIQSTMSLKDPFALELDYTQAIMSFLLFLPKPRNILMLGLGGGSLAKFCYRNVGSARITVVEIDPRVIAFRDQFELPPDDERLQVREGDGADAVIESGGWSERPDVIVMDAFDRHGISGSVNSRYFYQTVHDALAGRGVMVANLAGERLDRAAHLAMIAEVFDDPQVRERGMVTTWPHPINPGLHLVSSPIKLSATPVRTDRPPPLLGEQTDEVLRTLLGYSEAHISALKEGQVI